MAWLWIITGLVLLYVGAEWLVKGAAALALRLGISTLVIGLTVVAMGTSAPELAVTIQAAVQGHGDMAASNVVGSNIFNIAVILGLSALICPITISRQVVRWDGPVMIGVTLLGILLLYDRHLSRLDGFVLFSGMVVYTIWTFKQARNVPLPLVETATEEINKEPVKKVTVASNLFFVVIGLGLLVLGSQSLVQGAVQLARQFGVSDTIIGLTIVSMGTSLPELAASVMAALKKQPDIAVGNIVGSCIANILLILGMSSMISPYQAAGLCLRDLITMLAASVLVLPLMATRFKLDRWEGALLLAGYGVYLFWLWPKT